MERFHVKIRSKTDNVFIGKVELGIACVTLILPSLTYLQTVGYLFCEAGDGEIWDQTFWSHQENVGRHAAYSDGQRGEKESPHPWP